MCLFVCRRWAEIGKEISMVTNKERLRPNAMGKYEKGREVKRDEKQSACKGDLANDQCRLIKRTREK